jgi:hypothetical protein
MHEVARSRQLQYVLSHLMSTGTAKVCHGIVPVDGLTDAGDLHSGVFPSEPCVNSCYEDVGME